MIYKTTSAARTPPVNAPAHLQFAGGGIARTGSDVTTLFEDITTRAGTSMQMQKTISDKADRWLTPESADYPN